MTTTSVRITVVDDQTLFRESLVSILASQPGVAVVGQARDGEEAVRQAIALNPDIVLMDLGLPRLDGLEATRRIKQRLPAVRIIILTAHTSDEMFRRALQAGVDGFVLKDARPEELVSAIRLTHAGNRLFHGRLFHSFIAAHHSELPYGLTARELEVLQALAAGQSNRSIGSRLRISEKTVRNHVSNVYAKLSVTGRAQAVLFALANGLISGGLSALAEQPG